MISKPGEITWITQATGKLTLTGGAVPGLVNDLVDDGVAVLDASVAYSSKRGGDQSNVVSAMPGGSKISVRTNVKNGSSAAASTAALAREDP